MGGIALSNNAVAAPAAAAPAAGTTNIFLTSSIKCVIQNCNSLNVSSLNRSTFTKTTSIKNAGADLVFLSDIRLNRKDKKINDIFRIDYKCFFNSTQARRGVGILIKHCLDLTVVNSFKDADENILLLHCIINGSECVLGAIYGPNTNDDNFFLNLGRGLRLFPDVPIILGGDWNATMSAAPADINLDIINMRDIPSRVRTDALLGVCTEFDLVDPFRLLNPLTKDYSYEPHGYVRQNRSRIDFFLVSALAAEDIKQCYIVDRFCKKSFDHRPVICSFGKQFKSGRKSINNRMSNHPATFHVAKLATYEVYIANITLADHGVRRALINDLCIRLDHINAIVDSLIEVLTETAWVPLSELQKDRRDDILTRLEAAWRDCIPLCDLELMPRSCDDDDFFDM